MEEHDEGYEPRPRNEQSDRCSVCSPLLEVILDMPTWTIPLARKAQEGIVAQGQVLHCGEERRVCIPLRLISRQIDKMMQEASNSNHRV